MRDVSPLSLEKLLSIIIESPCSLFHFTGYQEHPDRSYRTESTRPEALPSAGATIRQGRHRTCRPR